jgi:ATP-dependent Lon protease
MVPFDNLSPSLENFTGTVRLFPLPNLVLFPHVIQPLHVFEARYLAMVEEALLGDRLVTLATLAPGWEKEYEGRPPIHRMACLGQITAHELRHDGKYDMLVLGLRRVRLVRELAGGKSFREAEVEVCEDVYPTQRPASLLKLQERLRKLFTRALTDQPEAQQQLEQILGADVPLGVLTDIVAHTLQLSSHVKRSLLAELQVDRRAELLLQELAAAASPLRAEQAEPSRFPPGFSLN